MAHDNPAGAPDLQRYLDDLETIRTLMIRSEEQPLVHHWVFSVWGILVIAGSIFTARTLPALTSVGLDPLIVIWLPILVVGSVVESLGAILKSKETGIPVITRRRVRLYFAAIGLVVLAGVTITHLDRVGFSTAILIAMGATPLLIYAQATYSDLFVEAYLLLAIAIIALLLGEVVETIPVRVVAGILIGVVYIFGGVHSWWRETVQRRTGGADAGSGAPVAGTRDKDLAPDRSSAEVTTPTPEA